MGRYEADLAAADLGAADAGPDEERTAILINKGRSSAHQPKISVSRKLVIGAIAVATCSPCWCCW